MNNRVIINKPRSVGVTSLYVPFNDVRFMSLYFYADWGKFKKFDKRYEKMFNEFPNISFMSFEIDDINGNAWSNYYKIENIPTVILLRNGVEFDRIVGDVLITPLRKVFRDFVKSF